MSNDRERTNSGPERREYFCPVCGESVGEQVVTENWEYLCNNVECLKKRVMP